MRLIWFMCFMLFQYYIYIVICHPKSPDIRSSWKVTSTSCLENNCEACDNPTGEVRVGDPQHQSPPEKYTSSSVTVPLFHCGDQAPGPDPELIPPRDLTDLDECHLKWCPSWAASHLPIHEANEMPHGTLKTHLNW